MKNTTSKKQNIRNPEKWIGKCVLHMANWRDFQWGNNGYVVCEETKTLLKMEDAENAYYGDTFETLEDATAAGYDPCYYYSEQGFYQMWQRANRKAA